MFVFNFTIFFAFLAMLLWGVGDFLIQKTVRRVGDFETLLWINLIAGLFLIPFVIKDLPLIFLGSNLISLILMTIVDLFYGFFLFRAYDEGKLSVVEVVMLGELPVTIVLGLIFFQETLNISQILVIIMIILGVLLISRTKGTWLDKVKEIFTGK
nr:DMT family transporter [Planctomycetota bacterium]